MRIFPPPLEIDADEGFSPQKDIFGRADLGLGLTNLVQTAEDPLVIAVDGMWGTGKTTFLKMWLGELYKLGVPTVYFDAFEHDYLDDAFVALSGEIIDLVGKKKKLSKGKQFIRTTMAAGRVLARTGLKIGAKVGTAGVLSGTEFDKISEEIGTAVSEDVDKYIGKLITHRREQRDAIHAFRAALSELPNLLADKKSNSDRRLPLVFVIDELDRCRPSFALAILERVKHFFSVPNVHFVLGVHSGQLLNSIQMTYGPNIEAQKYLQKFIILTFFPYSKADNARERTARKFVHFLAGAMEFETIEQEEREVIDSTTQIIGDIAVEMDLSLRDIERVMTTFAIAIAYSPKNLFRAAPILAGLAILKVLAPPLYLQAKRGTLKFDDVRLVLGLDDSYSNAAPTTPRARLSRWWFFVTEAPSDKAFDGLREYVSGNYHFDDPKSIIPFVANEVMDRFRT